MEKCDFWVFERLNFLGPNEGFFSISNIIEHYFWSYFDRQQIKKKNTFFDQKHGLTPLEKCDFFFGLKNIEFFMGKKGFFSIYNIIKHYF